MKIKKLIENLEKHRKILGDNIEVTMSLAIPKKFLENTNKEVISSDILFIDYEQGIEYDDDGEGNKIVRDEINLRDFPY